MVQLQQDEIPRSSERRDGKKKGGDGGYQSTNENFIFGGESNSCKEQDLTHNRFPVSITKMTKVQIFKKYVSSVVDPAYKNICDARSEPSLRAREFVERLWAVYEPYAERDFLREIQRNFNQRFWEMYLTCAILDAGLHVVEKKKNPEGPDVCVRMETNTIWFEAMCPTRGEDGKLDSVPDITACDGKIPYDPIVLSILSAIKEKYNNKYFQYRNKSIIKEGDPYVVAVNTWQVFTSGLDIDPHPLYRSVYGVGSQTILFDRETFEPIDLTYEEKTTILKSSGEPVATDIFSHEEFKYLSAVLWSAANAGNPTDVLGDDFRLARNPLAVNSILEELFEKRKPLGI